MSDYTIGLISKFWNEEVLLPLFLHSIKDLPFNKVYICDDGSTDASPEICETFIVSYPHIETFQIDAKHTQYFTETKAESEKINALLDTMFISGIDWVIHLDTDEYLSPPLATAIFELLKKTPPHYGVYCPILDLIRDPTTFISYNEDTKFQHYPCPHLKIFGRASGYRRNVDGMNLDQGVYGGDKYIMLSYPYLHLKYLFKNRRSQRGSPLNIKHKSVIPKNVTGGKVPTEFIPQYLTQWWEKWEEPGYTW